MDRALIEKAADLLVHARHVIALTGAGISTESGVPDFRSPGGIWERFDPTIFFYERFVANPGQTWKSMLEMYHSGGLSLWDARPNRGHLALARLEACGILKAVITQNIDNLHQKAGSRAVIEFHGNMLYAKCLDCGRRYAYDEVLRIAAQQIPPCCGCGGVLKPDAVFFGEAIPSEALSRSFEEAHLCDAMLVVGTSAQVEPAASLPLIAKGMDAMPFRRTHLCGALKECRVIEINREPTPLTGEVSDFLIQGSAGDVLDAILAHIPACRGCA